MKNDKSKPARHMSRHALKRAGVKLYGSGGTYVEKGAVIERGAELHAPCHISADCHICSGAVVMPYTCLQGTYVGSNAVVCASISTGAHIGCGTTVGPYAYLRGGTVIGSGCRIGDFAELKAATVGDGSKIAHMAYVGDADIGKNVNIGCGVVFANYDGRRKHKTVVGDNCFIGCNCNIVAPVCIKEGAYVAAGTTLTCDLEAEDLCVGRCRERVKPHGAAGRYNVG